MRTQTNPPIQLQTDTPEGLISASFPGDVIVSTKKEKKKKNQDIKTSVTS